MDLTPDTAIRIVGGEQQAVPATEVVAGDILLIRPVNVFRLTVVLLRAPQVWTNPC